MFSELIDKVISVTGRRDRLDDICEFARGTMQECQVLQLFSRDMTETTVTPTADPHIWTRPSKLRILRAVKYPSFGYIRSKPPGRIQEGHEQYYYGGSNYYAFKGALETESIQIAYYSYFPKLLYYEDGARPAVFDNETQEWTYLLNGAYVDTLGDDDTDEEARALVSNWMLEDWNHLVLEGTKTKLFNDTDDPRAPKTFALFKSYKSDLLRGESFDTADF